MYLVGSEITTDDVTSDNICSVAVINGNPVILPESAKYVVMDQQGHWHHSKRKIIFCSKGSGEWSYLKTRIYINDNGKIKPLVSTDASGWRDSLTETTKMKTNMLFSNNCITEIPPLYQACS